MKKIQAKAFTLVELLVVITILAIISVVAYQGFGGATNKAVSARKLSDVGTIESSLQQYKVDKNYYPQVDEYSASGAMWGYNPSENATPSNTLSTEKNGDEITAIKSANGGGKILGISTYSSQQIGAKGTISQSTLGKRYLSRDLFDPDLGDIRIGSEKMIDKGIGRYIYAVYSKPLGSETTWSANRQGSYYNIAYTIQKEGGDTYITRIVGDYDQESCFDKRDSCPASLIGSGDAVLTDKQENSSSDSKAANQGIPYPLANY